MSEERKKLRWVKFWYGDWRKDAALKMCSLAARGLWMEMLGIMHEAEPYGYLLVNGRKPTARQLASLVGASEGEVLALVEELRDAGVYSVREDGVPYSRRMLRDAKAAEDGKQWGSKGGSPYIPRKNKGEEGGLTPPDKSQVKLEREEEGEKEVREETPLPPEAGGAVVLRPTFGKGQQGPVTKLEDAPAVTKRGRVRNGTAKALEGFELFYSLYPRKVGEGQAEKAWPKAVAHCGGDFMVIIDGLNARLHLLMLEAERGYCKHPATWLNARGWKDAIPGVEDEDETALPLLTGGKG